MNARRQIGYIIGNPDEYMKQIRMLLNIWANFSPASICRPVYKFPRSLCLSSFVLGSLSFVSFS